MSVEKLDELATIVSNIQERLVRFEVPARQHSVLAILSDLLVAVDIASRDIYWAKKEILEDNIFHINDRKI